MAFNLIAESTGPIRWQTLHAEIHPIPPCIECFPIPSTEKGQGDALGISLLFGDGRAQETWDEFLVLVRRLWKARLKVIEMYSGTDVTPESINRVRAMFMA